MPYAANPIDGIRTYFEDAGGAGPPVLFYPGYADSVEWSKNSDLARALGMQYRLIFADHRGHGLSDKPHDPRAYTLTIRVADSVAVLDALGIERAHFIGISWGARLGFAIGEHAPERLLSLVLCGNQPYAWDPDGPTSKVVTRAVDAGRTGGMPALLASWEDSIGTPFPNQVREWILENDAEALAAAFDSVWAEGDVSADLTRWRVPCLIYAGEDDDMRPNAERAASEIAGAKFVALPRRDHYSAAEEAEAILPHVVELFGRTSPA